VFVLTISTNGEEELPEPDEDEDEPVLPRPPVVAPPVVPVVELEDPVLDVEEVDAVEVDPAVTESPGERLATDATVPLTGAYSLVLLTAVCAVLTLACAL
jgi:hypothetical protein